MSKLKITETVLRDGQQSMIATRLKTSEILPIIETMDQVGYYSMEVWGGATFDSCLRYLNEDPWERLTQIRKRVNNTKLQMLLRGQNLLGYRHYPNDIVDRFIAKSIDNGIDIIRIFDALNDINNLKSSIESIKKYGAHCQCAISYTISKVHTIEYYLKLVRDFQDLGADSICIKDMSGILKPFNAYELINKMKKVTHLPIELHGHCTSGVASMAYMKAIDAGVDIIDTAISPFSDGTSQPPTETFVVAYQGLDKYPDLDIEALNEVADYFKVIKEKYTRIGILNPRVLDTEPKTLSYQVPGGMISNLLSQLKSQNEIDKFDDVLKEVPRVREDLGYPPLVTPISQMVGAQALFNILTQERYQIVPKEVKNYVRGFYGRSPAPINKNVIDKIIGDEEMIPKKVNNEDSYEKAKSDILDLYESEEDILSYILFPQVAKEFLENRKYENEYKTLTPI